jgi:hypothetical protein
MVMTISEAFEQWMNEPWANQTRLEFVKGHGTEVEDMLWAFSRGWVMGQQQAVKDVLEE